MDTKIISHRVAILIVLFLALAAKSEAGAARKFLPLARSYTIDMPVAANFFKDYYSKKGMTFEIIRIKDNYFMFSVRKARGEVIKDENFWEKLEILLVVFKDTLGVQDFLCIVDGEYAPGMGRKEPKREGYEYKMEPLYTEEVMIYANRIITIFEENLPKFKKRFEENLLKLKKQP